MNIESIAQIKGMLHPLIERETRTDGTKPARYSSPVSLPTYGTEGILESRGAFIR